MTKVKLNYITYKVILPICLHLDDRRFAIPFKKNSKIEIILSNFFSNKYSNLGKATNAEVDSDTFSHYRFTRMTMKIPYFKKEIIEREDISTKYDNVFLKYYNQFIDIYRIVSDRSKIRNIWNTGEFLQPIIVEASEEINPEQFGVASFSFGDGKLVGAKPLRSNEEHIKIQVLLDNPPYLYQNFIADAKRELHFGNFIQSNINVVVALEIVVSDIIKKYALEKGIEEKSIKEFIKDVGLTGNIKTTLKLILSSDKDFPENNIFQNCKAAITQRNHIVHDGLRSIAKSDLEKQFEAIEKLICYLIPLVYN